MKKHPMKRILLLSLGFVLASCAAPIEQEVATTTSALTGLPSTGFVPLPINTEMSDPQLGPSVPVPASPPTSSWDGTLGDLIAADALAACMSTSTGARSYLYNNIYDYDLDPYLNQLLRWMASAACIKHSAGKFGRIEWGNSRRNPSCNINTLTGQPAALPEKTSIASDDAQTNAFASLSTAGSNSAYSFVNYATLNLCMALQVRESLNSAEILFASDDEQGRMLGIARERAQLATIGFAQLGQAIRSSQTKEASDPKKYIGHLKDWALNPANAAHATYFGQNFAMATRTMLEATNEYARYLRRRAAMTQSGTARAEAVWGEGSPRSRLMNLLFGGGDPMGPVSGDLTGGRAYGGKASMRGAAPAHVKTSMRNPQVQALLQLSRSADALYLRDLQGTSPKIDVQASAERLYRQVEQHLQKRACEQRNPLPANSTDPMPCGDSAMWALVPPLSNYTQSLTWTNHEIKPEHATTLVTALSEALGELGLPLVNPPPALYEGLFHLFGANGRRTPPDAIAIPEQWLHIDPQFSIAAFSAAELGTQYSRTLLPFNLIGVSGNVHPIEAGFFLWQPSNPNPWAGAVPNLDLATLQAQNWEDQRQAGATAVLEFARFSIVHGLAAGLESPYFIPTRDVLNAISAAIGERSTSIVPLGTVTTTNDAKSCSEIDMASSSSCTRYVFDGRYRVGLLQPTVPVRPGYALAPGHKRLLQTVTINPSTTTFDGTSATDLPANTSPLSRSPMGEGYSWYTSFASPGPVSSDLFIVEGTSPNKTYTPIFRTGEPGTYHITFGGSFGQMAEQVMAVSPMDWSEPRYDAFGLLTNWVPPADASLIGGQPGEESYSFYLKAAKDAAAQATSAVKTAIDNVTQEAIEKEALEASETKAKGVAELTKRGLCGDSMSCDVGQSFLYATYSDFNYRGDTGSSTDCPDSEPAYGAACDPSKMQICYYSTKYCGCAAGISANNTVTNTYKCLSNPRTLEPKAPPSCVDPELLKIPGTQGTVVATGKELCENERSQVKQALGRGLRLAFPVWQAADQNAVPTFAEYSGSKLQAVLVRQWNAVRLLKQKYDAYLDATLGHGSRVAIALAEVRNAGESYYNLVTRINERLGCHISLGAWVCPCADAAATKDPVKINAACVAQGANGQNVPLSAFADQYFQLNIARDQRAVDRKIKENLRCVATDGAVLQPGTAQIGAREAAMIETCGASAGCAAAVSAKNQCDDTFTIWSTSKPAVDPATGKEIDPAGDLETLILKQLGSELLTLEDQKVEAEHAYDTKLFDRVKAVRDVNTDLATVLTELLDQVGVINETNADLARLNTDAQAADATAALDTAAQEIGAKTRFALRRSFNSYDFWRARALLDSARVMSLAARRAIETRFVVNLSDISTDQPFVKAPSQWADEVYATDLDAPSSVGLTVGAPQTQGGIYPNKLLDYVTNLERFVQGYATEYPTSIAAPDSELLTLPGPDQYRELPGLTPTNPGGRMLELTGDSKGWSFFCESSGKWIAHPLANSGPFDATAAHASLSTACDGYAPTRARYPFMLNPWGVQQSPFGRSQTYANRYNVRWRRLGVNLVGTGVRDCGQAQDTLACYSSGFVRYSLNHTGPAWLTDYQEEWRSQLIPRANIEGAKALAAEEWLDPVTRAWNLPAVASIGRGELAGRPTSGVYDLILELGSDVRPDRIERIQLLTEYDYWVANGRSSGGSSAQ